VTVAVDEWYQHRQKDAEGDFYREVVYQGPRGKIPDKTTQGLYVFRADGKLLGFTNHRSPDRIRAMIDKALKEFTPPEETATAAAAKPDAAFVRALPEGGLVADVTAKVFGGYGEPKNDWQKFAQAALGRDHLWIRKDETEALARGELSEGLRLRIARFHFVDNTRGEPPMWTKAEVKTLEMTVKDGVIAGRVHLETSDRGFIASIGGTLEVKEGKVARFDLVAKGEFWGEGTYTQGAPSGRFPFAVSIRLAGGKAAADKVPPQGSRDLRDYLR
jgi:hypothetical protein